MTRQIGDDDGDDSDATTEEEASDKGDDVGESEGPTSRDMNITKDVASCMGSDVSLVETLQSDQNVDTMKDLPPTVTYYSSGCSGEVLAFHGFPERMTTFRGRFGLEGKIKTNARLGQKPGKSTQCALHGS
jgi:hypothetical protein